jgi:hypothetical protein
MLRPSSPKDENWYFDQSHTMTELSLLNKIIDTTAMKTLHVSSKAMREWGLRLNNTS